MKTLPLIQDGDALTAGLAALDTVRSGGVVLLPTESFYGLGVDPDNPDAVARIFDAKRRPGSRALPVLCSDWQQLETLVAVPDEHRVRLSRCWPAALTVVLRAHRPIAASPGGTVAVRIPDHGLLRAVLYRTGPLTGTSANRHGSPPQVEVDAALESLTEHPDLVLEGGTLPGGEPSTIVDLTADQPTILRQGSVLWDEPFPWDQPQ
jgi:tRNA threonylcarbamoyl adenosine modification protein (Sua5/YciO/YrdC/YwlC family)